MAEIGSIPDVTAAQAQAMAALGLHTTDDLLRTERGALTRLTGFSLSQVKGWQAVAELAQVRALALDDAVRLHAAGVDSLDEVSRWSLARLRTTLPHLDDEALLELARDVVRLRHTGVVNGNVTLRDGSPVEGAAVTVAGRDALSDAMGRFRVTRLPLDRTVNVTVHHPASGYRLVTGVPVMRAGALEGYTVVLSGRRRTPKVLSERRGDRLPPLGGSVVTTRVEPTPPETDDLLVLLDRHADGSFGAASMFLDFDNGRFVRRTYRLAAADLPVGARTGQGLVWSGSGSGSGSASGSGSGWVAAVHGSRDVARRVRLRRAQATLGAPPTTDAEAVAQVRTLLRAASDPPRRTR